MKQTIKKLAVKFGKKIVAAMWSALAMLIGEFIIGLFGKGIAKFKTVRVAKKESPVDAANAGSTEDETNKAELGKCDEDKDVGGTEESTENSEQK